MEGRSSPLRRFPAWLLAAAVVGACGWAVWHYYPPRGEATRSSLEWTCTPPPAYVPPAFLGEIRQQAGLPDRFDQADQQSVKRLSAAFAAHPWVESVRGVYVRPGIGVHVELVYRVPVAVVVVRRPGQEANYLIDRHGRLLPSASETGAGSEQLLRIVGAAGPPAGPPGTPWGDPQLEEAARLAYFLSPHRAALHMESILLGRDPLLPDLRLRTKGGTELIWQNFSEPHAATPTAEQKLARLQEYVREWGSLEKPAGPYLMDVRSARGMVRRPLP